MLDDEGGKAFDALLGADQRLQRHTVLFFGGLTDTVARWVEEGEGAYDPKASYEARVRPQRADHTSVD